VALRVLICMSFRPKFSRFLVLSTLVFAGSASAAQADVVKVSSASPAIAGQFLNNGGFGAASMAAPLSTARKWTREFNGLSNGRFVLRSVSETSKCLQALNNLVVIRTCSLAVPGQRWTLVGGRLKADNSTTKVLSAEKQSQFISSLLMKPDSNLLLQRFKSEQTF
jgi:hypothetical protein